MANLKLTLEGIGSILNIMASLFLVGLFLEESDISIKSSWGFK
jgi:hypothetical protein